jgi:hypothetical protein
MKINLWQCPEMDQWRWTVTDNSRPIVRQESGQNTDLHGAMIDMEKTVQSMMESKQK